MFFKNLIKRVVIKLRKKKIYSTHSIQVGKVAGVLASENGLYSKKKKSTETKIVIKHYSEPHHFGKAKGAFSLGYIHKEAFTDQIHILF